SAFLGGDRARKALAVAETENQLLPAAHPFKGCQRLADPFLEVACAGGEFFLQRVEGALELILTLEAARQVFGLQVDRPDREAILGRGGLDERLGQLDRRIERSFRLA